MRSFFVSVVIPFTKNKLFVINITDILKQVNVLKTKIIIIGSGGAGLTAAIAAANPNTEVLVLSKTSCGTNCATTFSSGIFTLASGKITKRERYEKLMEIGQNLNSPDLVRFLVYNAEDGLKKIQSWGVGVRFPSDGLASVRHTSTHKFMGGEGMIAQLVTIAKSKGVKFISSTVATKLLCDENGICGVRCVNWQNGRSELLFADAVIIATGGAGQIFSRTDNPRRLTGDGFALALDVGLELIDMEFTQFYPMGWADKALPVWMADMTLADYAPVTDAEGEEFLMNALHSWGYKSGNEGNFYARDRAAALIAIKDAQSGVYFHLEQVSEDQWHDKGFIRSLILNVNRFKDIHRPVRVAPIHHYFCGGIKINNETRTELPNLFACGEVTGGIDGANRVGGNALANIITFGLRAGKMAAATPPRGAYTKANIAEKLPVFRENMASPSEIRSKLQKKMWKCLGPIRTKEGITQAIDFLQTIESVPLTVKTRKDLLEALEMPGLLKSAMAVALAALKREKSCGTHFIADCTGFQTITIG